MAIHQQGKSLISQMVTILEPVRAYHIITTGKAKWSEDIRMNSHDVKQNIQAERGATELTFNFHEPHSVQSHICK